MIEPLGLSWTLSRLLGRVTAVTDETPDTRTFELTPNWHWPGFKPGQHVQVAAEINGRRYWRSFSISSDPAKRRRIALTIKRQDQGRVTRWLHEHARVGTLLRLRGPAGDFGLPDGLENRILMISAGSGVTPMRALLHAIEARGGTQELTFVHVCRRPEDAIFADELRAWAARWPALRLHWHYTAEQGRPALRDLLAHAPDYATRHTFLCGPEDFMQPLRDHWADAGLTHRLFWESYGLHSRSTPTAEHTTVSCLRSGGQFQATGTEPLLFAAERAGYTPAYGCRRGLCHSCRTRKRAGVTQNLLTGEISAEADEMIQLCICVARSDLQLEEL